MLQIVSDTSIYSRKKISDNSGVHVDHMTFIFTVFSLIWKRDLKIMSGTFAHSTKKSALIWEFVDPLIYLWLFGVMECAWCFMLVYFGIVFTCFSYVSLTNINTVCKFCVIATNIVWCSSDFIFISQPIFYTATLFCHPIHRHGPKKKSASSKTSTNTPYVIHLFHFIFENLFSPSVYFKSSSWLSSR